MASASDLVHVDQALLFFLDQVLEGFVDLHLPLLGALAEEVGQHVLDVDVHLLDALVGDDLEGREIAFAHVDFDGAVVELAFAQLLAKFLAGAALRFMAGRSASSLRAPCRRSIPRRARGARGKQNIQQALFGVQLGLVGDVFELFFAHHFDGDLDQVANHGFDIASHVADFGELRSFHFQEWRVGELGQAAGDFGLAHAGGADHDDVLGDDFFRQVRSELLAAHAIAQSDGDGALGVLLADDMLVQLGDDLTRSEFVESDLFFFSGSG